MIKKQTVWVIMTKDRKRIAKGTPRNRHMVDLDDETDKKRYLTYSSPCKAYSAFVTNGFYGVNNNQRQNLLEVVEVEITMEFK
ncbi:MAG TPA: hypothetical protein VMV86_05625 [Methanosarcinales archaeon]|nr:hypothetical protein [Methanosarcinales archaeon]